MEQLGQALGCSRRQVHYLLSGEQACSLEQLGRIAVALRIAPEVIADVVLAGLAAVAS
ncbi:MAG: hypothetical protein ACRD0K_12610 [Egibacteraceae bacterium]